jgi:SAM-dependent methyltransferase
MANTMSSDLFWQVHADLPREGPGDDESTLRALALMKNLPSAPSVLDIACGPGAQTLALVGQGAKVTAIDTHQPFLDELVHRAARAGVAERVKTLNMSMFELDFNEKFDVLWSEGAIYLIGFEKGLRTWRPLLKPGGYLAVTEISWLKPNPPAEVFKFWREAYPEMASVTENVSRVVRAGYHLLGHFTLPESAWWQPYYQPIEARIAQLREKYQGNLEAQSILDGHAEEVEMYRKYSDWYGYEFYVIQANDR